MNTLSGPNSENVHFTEALAKIQEASKSGKKIGLFIGRQAHEDLPVEEGWVWVSLDLEQGQTLDPNRIHLQCNFNEKNSIAKIEHLFDKVVVDLEVTKYFSDDTLQFDPVQRLSTLLKTSQMSLLILPCETLTSFHEGTEPKPINFNRVSHLESESKGYEMKCMALLDDYKENSAGIEEDFKLFKEDNQNYYDGLGLTDEELRDDFYDIKMQDLAKQQGLLAPEANDDQIVRENMQKLLAQAFDGIEFHSSEEFPYESTRGTKETRNYFIAHDPK